MNSEYEERERRGRCIWEGQMVREKASDSRCRLNLEDGVDEGKENNEARERLYLKCSKRLGICARGIGLLHVDGMRYDGILLT